MAKKTKTPTTQAPLDLTTIDISENIDARYEAYVAAQNQAATEFLTRLTGPEGRTMARLFGWQEADIDDLQTSAAEMRRQLEQA